MRKVQEEQKEMAQETEARQRREEEEKKIRAAYEEARKMQEKVIPELLKIMPPNFAVL